MVKKIMSLKTIIIWSLLTTLFLIMSILFIILLSEEYLLNGLFIGLTIISFIMIFVARTTILIDENSKTIKLLLSPLIDPQRTRQERIKLDDWNNNVNIEDVKNFEIIKLSKEVKRKDLGSKYIFNCYIKFEMNDGRQNILTLLCFPKNKDK